jgi:hypothetical protein
MSHHRSTYGPIGGCASIVKVLNSNTIANALEVKEDALGLARLAREHGA